MSTYICSDVHGRYIQLRKILGMVGFTDDDILIINGDLSDRGSESAKCIEFVLDRDNVELLIGNHELMYINSFEESPSYLYGNGIPNIDCEESINLNYNGGNRTVRSLGEYYKIYGRDLVKEYYEYIKKCQYYKTIKDLTISHTGIENESILEDLTEFVWQRDFFEEYFYKEKLPITKSQIIGHSPLGRNYIVMEPGNTEFSFIKTDGNKFILDLDASNRSNFIPLYCVEKNELHLNKWNQHMILNLNTMEVVIKE